MIMKQLLISVFLLLTSFSVLAEKPNNDVANLDDLDPLEWGIRNDCISTQRIRNVDVLDTESAVLEMTGGKKILMTFKNTCRGLKHNGFVYSSRTGQLCAKFDSVKVVGNGNVCMLESFEPFVELDSPDETAEDE